MNATDENTMVAAGMNGMKFTIKVGERTIQKHRIAMGASLIVQIGKLVALCGPRCPATVVAYNPARKSIGERFLIPSAKASST